MHKVVITGLGAVSPLGVGAEVSWNNLIAGKSGAGRITTYDNVERFACTIACEIDDAFNAEDWMAKKEIRRLDKFVVFAVAAARLAFDDAGWRPQTEEERCRTGTIVSSGIGGLQTIEEGNVDMLARNKTNPFFVPKLLVNMAAGQVSISEKLKGPIIAPVTACASGAHSIGEAAELIKRGAADVMIAGGAEAAITPLGVAGFCSCKAMSTHFNETPEKASRPYDKDRDGFVMGEGAAALILESEEHAKKRGAKIYAEVTGYGMSGDAYHITSPDPSGDGAYRAMLETFKYANLSPAEIGYINAHGTSTPMGDEVEIKAIERVYGNEVANLNVSSTKSATGHLLGAAGALEAIFAIYALRQGIIPPTLNLDNCDVESALNLTPHEAQTKTLKHVMSNSFGFGGANASLIFSHYQ